MTQAIPCWMDLLTSDTNRARDFYGRVLGWTAGDASPEFGGYFMFFNGGAPVAGCMPFAEGMDVSDVWTTYLTVADADAAVRQAANLNGTIRVPAMPVADLGIQAIIDDPDGARFGIWQPQSFPGFGSVGTGTLGTPAWFELHALNYEDEVSFYENAVGWVPQVMSDTPEFRLTAIEDPGRQPVAGIQDGSGYLQSDENPRWDVYVSVDSTDKTLELATSLGGTITSEAMDSPFGRLAGLKDPMGARFKVVSR